MSTRLLLGMVTPCSCRETPAEHYCEKEGIDRECTDNLQQFKVLLLHHQYNKRIKQLLAKLIVFLYLPIWCCPLTTDGYPAIDTRPIKSTVVIDIAILVIIDKFTQMHSMLSLVPRLPDLFQRARDACNIENTGVAWGRGYSMLSSNQLIKTRMQA